MDGGRQGCRARAGGPSGLLARRRAWRSPLPVLLWRILLHFGRGRGPSARRSTARTLARHHLASYLGNATAWDGRVGEPAGGGERPWHLCGALRAGCETPLASIPAGSCCCVNDFSLYPSLPARCNIHRRQASGLAARARAGGGETYRRRLGSLLARRMVRAVLQPSCAQHGSCCILPLGLLCMPWRLKVNAAERTRL